MNKKPIAYKVYSYRGLTPTDDACDLCKKMSAGSPYTDHSKLPPYHDGCRCFAIPVNMKTDNKCFNMGERNHESKIPGFRS